VLRFAHTGHIADTWPRRSSTTASIIEFPKYLMSALNNKMKLYYKYNSARPLSYITIILTVFCMGVKLGLLHYGKTID
jgi:hypothetical protein